MLAVFAAITELSVSDRDRADPRGIRFCPAGAEQDLMGAHALRCWLDAPSGPTIVLIETGAFLLALALGPRTGLLANRRRAAPAV